MTLAEAQTLRTAWYNAEIAVAGGQEYQIGTRRLTRADAEHISERLAYYDRLVDQLTAGTTGGVQLQRIVPRDL